MKTSEDQASFFPEVAHARSSDPIESHFAAASVKTSHMDVVKERILACFIYGEANDEELIRRYRDLFPEDKVSDSGIRSRRSQLLHPRWGEKWWPARIEKTGERVPTSHGRPSAVHRLVVRDA